MFAKKSQKNQFKPQTRTDSSDESLLEDTSDENSDEDSQMTSTKIVHTKRGSPQKSQPTVVVSQAEVEADDASSAEETPNNEHSDEEREVTVTERELFRKQISTMSFEDLQKLKEKIGSKQYNKVVFGTKPKRTKTDFKRANKNRPREMSSKKRSHIQEQLIQVKKNPPRDPRFDPLCGTYDEKEFKSNFKFLKDVRKKERVQLEEEYEKETDPKRQQKIKFLMQRMDNQIREQEKRDKQMLNKEEEQQEIRKKLKHGEKPVYKKKSEKRIEELVNQYEELKKTNKLQKHLERRYKKLAQKDRKNAPSTDVS